MDRDLETLPVLDTSQPGVQTYLSLVRLQVLTPVSLIFNITTVAICAFFVDPSIGAIFKLHPTSISPQLVVVSVYVAASFLWQIGYCFLLVTADDPDTKRVLVKGVGYSLALANFLVALGAIVWVMEWFLISTVLQGIILLILAHSNVTLLAVYHPITFRRRQLDAILIHAPTRLLFVLSFSILFPLSLFVTCEMAYTPGRSPTDYSVWTGFTIVIATNLVGLLATVFYRDTVWAVATTWICVSLWSMRPKLPYPIYLIAVAFTVLHPWVLAAVKIYDILEERNVYHYIPFEDEYLGYGAVDRSR